MKVVYTAVTGGRDTVEPPGLLPPGWHVSRVKKSAHFGAFELV